MDCNAYQKLINPYIEKTLIGKELDDFINHICSCSECKEELVINYSVLTALDQLDRGEDLSEDYEVELNSALKLHIDKKKKHRRLVAFSMVATFFTAFIFGLFLSFFIWFRDTTTYGEVDDIQIVYDGVPASFDKVNENMDLYNAQIIDYLHERTNHE